MLDDLLEHAATLSAASQASGEEAGQAAELSEASGHSRQGDANANNIEAAEFPGVQSLIRKFDSLGGNVASVKSPQPLLHRRREPLELAVAASPEAAPEDPTASAAVANNAATETMAFGASTTGDVPELCDIFQETGDADKSNFVAATSAEAKQECKEAFNDRGAVMAAENLDPDVEHEGDYTSCSSDARTRSAFRAIDEAEGFDAETTSALVKAELSMLPSAEEKIFETIAAAEVKAQAVEVEASAEAETKVDAKAETEGKTEAETKAAKVEGEAEEEAKVQAEAEAGAKIKAEAKAEAKVEAEAKPEAKVEAEAKAEAKVEAEAEAEAKVEREAEAGAKVEAEAKAEARVEAEAKAEAKVEAEAEAEAEAKVYSEGAAKTVESASEPNMEAEAEADAQQVSELVAKVLDEAEAAEAKEDSEAQAVREEAAAAGASAVGIDSDDEVAVDNGNETPAVDGSTAATAAAESDSLEQFDDAIEEVEDNESQVMETAEEMSASGSVSASTSTPASQSTASATAEEAPKRPAKASAILVSGDRKLQKQLRRRRGTGADTGAASDYMMVQSPKKRRPLLSNCARTLRNKVLDASRTVMSLVSRSEEPSARTRALLSSASSSITSAAAAAAANAASAACAAVEAVTPVQDGEAPAPPQSPPDFNSDEEPLLPHDLEDMQNNNSALQCRFDESSRASDANFATCADGATETIEPGTLSMHVKDAALATRMSFAFIPELAALVPARSATPPLLVQHARLLIAGDGNIVLGGYGEAATFIAVGEDAAGMETVGSLAGSLSVAAVTSVHGGPRFCRVVRLQDANCE